MNQRPVETVSVFLQKYLKDAGYVQKKNFKLYTGNGPVEVTFLNEDGSRLRVSMGKLSFWSDEIPVIGERREVINEDMVFEGRCIRLPVYLSAIHTA